MAVQQAGACTAPKTCGGFAGLQCPSKDAMNMFPYADSHFCARLAVSPKACNIADLPAPCWGLPTSCAVVGFGGNYNSCPPSGKKCQYECDAIKQGVAYYKDMTCPQ
jgi:hypothetical protein